MKSENFIPSEANVARRNAITKALLTVTPGTIISYAEISRQVGFSVRDFGSQLSYVKSKLIRDHHVVFGIMRGEGLIRLTSQGILLLAESREAGTRRRSKKDVNILICANRRDLDHEEQMRYDIMLKKTGFNYAVARDETAAERLAPFVYYPKSGPEIGADLRAIFGSGRRKLSVAASKPAA
jgi:hypothetical protein